MRHLTLLFFIILGFGTARAQAPANDNCDKPFVIPDPRTYCSSAGAFSNIGATPSGYGPANCFANGGNDVWFSFVAAATDVNIVIKGRIGVSGAGGTLTVPEAALYQGVCGQTLTEWECQNDNTGSGIVQLYQSGLIVGTTYLIRVQGRNNGVGTFQLCINNYNPPKDPSGDCISGSILCDKSPFVVKAVVGAGNNITEANGAPCFSNGIGGGLNVEMNSTWFKWTCERSGTLTFTLRPLKEDDDLDFIVYELPNGIDNCNGKQILRCMAAGDSKYPSPCMGPTGLNLTATDVSEDAGCGTGKDNFIRALDMVAGRSYALMINNFTSTGTGFSIEFGGTGTFVGPQADFKTSAPNNTVCYGDSIIFSDASTFALGVVNKWHWIFGEGAVPATADGKGPHTVRYTKPGPKSVALIIETERGCQVTKIGNVTVDPCCDNRNAIRLVGTQVTDLKCFDIFDGAINLSVSSRVPIVSYLWSNQQTTRNISNLASGTYAVTVTNDATCDTVFTVKVNAPPPIAIDTLITKPTCNGGRDGAIQLNVGGGVSPYTYRWASGAVSNRISNLPVGQYPVTVTDANGCIRNLTINLRELELELDPRVQTIRQPSCFGLSNGSITMAMANGLPPFQFDFNDGKGYVNTNTLQNIPAGTYTVNVRDANGCKGVFNLNVGQPDKLEVTLDSIGASCFGLSDGAAAARVKGGTGNYAYRWSNGSTLPAAANVPAGTYTVTVTDANGCTMVKSTAVTQPPQLDILPVRTVNVLCHGDATGLISVIGKGGTPGYEYSIDGSRFDRDTTFKNLPAGDYTLTVVDSLGCKSSVSVSVLQPPRLTVNAGRDTSVELGYSLLLNAVVAPQGQRVTYSWSPLTGFTGCTDCPRPEILPLKTTTYAVTVTDASGCKAVDRLVVEVFKPRPIFIPNVFSPDYDGHNDRFTAFGNQSAKQIRLLRVFNRWGGLVYEAFNIPLNDDRHYGWDGTFNGEPLLPSVFAYYMEIEFIDGEVILYKGDITIIK